MVVLNVGYLFWHKSIRIPKKLCFSQTWANLGSGFVLQVIFVEFVATLILSREAEIDPTYYCMFFAKNITWNLHFYLGMSWNLLGFLMCEKQWIFGFLPARWSRQCLPSYHETNQARTLSKKPFKVSFIESFEEFHTSESHFNKTHLSLAYSKVEMYRHFESGCSKNFSWYPFYFPRSPRSVVLGFRFISRCNFWSVFLFRPET